MRSIYILQMQLFLLDTTYWTGGSGYMFVIDKTVILTTSCPTLFIDHIRVSMVRSYPPGV